MQVAVLVARALSALNAASGVYDGIVYVAFLVSSVFVFALLKKQRDLAWNVWMEILVTFLLISAVFKSTIYDNSPLLANAAVLLLLTIAAAIKVFSLEISSGLSRLSAKARVMSSFGPIASCAAIAALVYVPNLNAVLAEVFIGEQAHHLDFFVMSPGWSCFNGGKPYVDVISQYGVGIPVIFANLSRILGGFDYLTFLQVNMAFGIMYFILFFWVTRAWLGSTMLGFAAFLVCFRLQMFHYGVSPLCWIYPSSTPIRFGLDILWLWLLWRHLQTGRGIFLILAALYSGFAVYFMTSTGIFIVVTFFAYLAGMLVLQSLRKEIIISPRLLAAAAVIPVVSAFVFFWITLGGHVVSQTFWKNVIEYMSYFSNGRGALPIFESLKYRNYWVALMALAVPLLYVATAVSVGIALWKEKVDRKYLFVVTIAVYGLVNYQYFVVRSAMTSYYINAVPFVLLCAFWADIAVKCYMPAKKGKIYGLCAILAFYALATNHNYISYPNLFNFSRNPLVDITVAQRFPDRQGYFHHLVKHIKEEDKVAFNAAGDGDEHLMTEDSFKTDKELIDFVKSENDFSLDAALIDSLVSSKEPTAVLSSFETKILIQAKRAPFFYHTPLITSQPMRVRYFPADAAHSPSFLADTLRQLEDKKPAYVFIENVFLQEIIPASYRESNANILTIIAYIRQNYTPFKRGQYLTAMKRHE